MIQLDLDQLLKGLPLHAATSAAIDKESGSAFQVKRVSVGQIARDFRVGGLGVDAASKLDAVDAILASIINFRAVTLLVDTLNREVPKALNGKIPDSDF